MSSYFQSNPSIDSAIADTTGDNPNTTDITRNITNKLKIASEQANLAPNSKEVQDSLDAIEHMNKIVLSVIPMSDTYERSLALSQFDYLQTLEDLKAA